MYVLLFQYPVVLVYHLQSQYPVISENDLFFQYSVILVHCLPFQYSIVFVYDLLFMLLSQYMICCFSLCSLGFVSSCFSTFCRFSILLFKHSVVSVYGLLFQYMFSYFSVCYVVSVSSSFSICSVVSELAGPKCIIEGNGFVLPFFPAAAKKTSFGRYGTLSGSTSVIVGLPCRYSPDSVELHFCDCNS